MELNQYGCTRLERTNFTINKLEEDKDQTFASRTNGDKCKKEREDTSLSKSPNSKSEKLQRKFKFQEKVLMDPKTDEIVLFFSCENSK